MTNQGQFIAATKRWYAFVSDKGAHKDRDCHFEIGKVQRYSYGEPPIEGFYWLGRHKGYITDFEEIGDTEEEVMEKLVVAIDQFLNDKDIKVIFNSDEK